MKAILKMFLIVVVGLITIVPLSSQARELNSRKGFFIGFDLGSGYLRLNNESQGAFLFDVKLGGGLTENILFMFEGGSAGSLNEDQGLVFMDFASQFFVYNNFYVRPRIGIGSLYNGNTYSADGFSAGASIGHEWRLTKRFALSGEAKSDYVRVNSSNHYNVGAAIDLRWYF